MSDLMGTVAVGIARPIADLSLTAVADRASGENPIN
jgi:hypothetical protein